MTNTLNKIKDCLSQKNRLKSVFDLNQKSILNAIINNYVVSVIKPRQAGITTVILYYVASLMKLSNDRKSIAYFGFDSSSENFLKKLGFLLRGYCENNLRVNRKDLYLEGSYFKIIQDYYKLRGAKFDVIIIDEAAYHKNLEHILTYASQALTSKGKLICISSLGGISDLNFQNFHFKLNNALELYKKDLLIEKKDSLNVSAVNGRMPHSVSLRCYKNPSTELKKEKLNIY